LNHRHPAKLNALDPTSAPAPLSEKSGHQPAENPAESVENDPTRTSQPLVLTGLFVRHPGQYEGLYARDITVREKQVIFAGMFGT
jgi:hypothetical protein